MPAAGDPRNPDVLLRSVIRPPVAGRMLAGLLLILSAASCSSDEKGDTSGGGGASASTGGGSAGSPDAGDASVMGSGGAGGSGGEDPGPSTGGVNQSSAAGGSTNGGGGDGGTGGDAVGGAAGSNGGGGLLLDDLTVDGVRLPLIPTFDPSVVRYMVYPTLPAEELTVTAVADDALTLTINGETVESGVATPLQGIEPDSEIELEVSDGAGASLTYTIVYVPEDFPELKVTVHEPQASTDPIYVSPQSKVAAYLIKLENSGVPLFYRRLDSAAYDFKKHPNGLYSYAATLPANNYEQVILDADFEEIGTITTTGLENTDNHEFQILPNGNYILLGYEPTTRDLTSWGGGADGRVRDSILQELSPDREVLFQWNSWDHMDYDERVGESDVDYAHANSITIDTDGDWLVSLRGLSQVVKIERTSGDVIWRLGGVSNDFEFINDLYAGLCGQHTAARVNDDNVLLFDNGQNCYPEMPDRGEHTRVVEYSLDETAMTAELVWSYSRKGQLYTKSQGSAQRLTNGNTFIGWGYLTDLKTVMATEVNSAGEVVFEIEASYPDDPPPASYRAVRISD